MKSKFIPKWYRVMFKKVFSHYMTYYCLGIIFFLQLLITPYVFAENLNIAMIVWRGWTSAENGFRLKLEELGYQVNYTVFNADQDRTRLGRILRKQIQFDQFDYIYTFGTTATKTVATVLDGQVPHIFNIVSDPVGANIIDNLEATGKNICGVSNMVPLELQIENAYKIKAFKNLGYFFNPREKNSLLILEKLAEIGKNRGFNVVSYRTPPVNGFLLENLQLVQNNENGLDAVYFPTDSFLISKADLIGREMQKSKMVSIGAVEKYISNGVMFGTVTNYQTLGKMAADILDRHQKGEELSRIPVQIQKTPVFMINKNTVAGLKVNIDSSLMKQSIIIE